jgi:hypothetical protein
MAEERCGDWKDWLLCLSRSLFVGGLTATSRRRKRPRGQRLVFFLSSLSDDSCSRLTGVLFVRG